MALTSVLKPDGFRPVASGKLEYTFTESSIAGKPNYRVEIELSGLGLPVFQYYPNSDLEITADIAPLLRTVLLLTELTTDRQKNTYVKYQAVWDGGSDSQVPLSSNIIYFYAGSNNALNKRSQFEILGLTSVFDEPFTSNLNSFSSVAPGDQPWTWIATHGGSAKCFLLNSPTQITQFLTRTTTITKGTRYRVTVNYTNGNEPKILYTYFGSTIVNIQNITNVSSSDTSFSFDYVPLTSETTISFRLACTVSASTGFYMERVTVTSDVGYQFLVRDSKLYVWPGRTAYIEWLNGLTTGWSITIMGTTYTGHGVKELVSIPINNFDADMTLSLKSAVLTWTYDTTPADNAWNDVVYGNGLFVAVAGSGSGNRVMTSPDGITWTIRSSAANNTWESVTYGGSLFVAVSSDGTGNRVMTSPDGITWTIRTSAANNTWESVTYGGGLFVAVSSDGANRVMTSSDGITWTSRSAAAANQWAAVGYGNSLFVAVSNTGSGNRVMTSPDGITWTSRTSAANLGWIDITYGDGLYVAVANSGTTGDVMTSPDGVTWTSRVAPNAFGYVAIIYGDGFYMALPVTGSGAIVAQSEDGIAWTTVASANDRNWTGIAFGSDMFIAVAASGTGNRAMAQILSPVDTVATLDVILKEECANPVYLRWINDFGGLSTWLFDQDQLFIITPEETGRYKKLGVVARTLTMDQWLGLEELNRAGAEYGDNQKLGAFVEDFTDEADSINIFTEEQEVTTQTKLPRHEFGLTLRYPIADNSDI